MRLRVNVLLLCTALSLPAAPRYSFHVLGGQPGAWPAILQSIGLQPGNSENAELIVAQQTSGASAADWLTRVEHGVILIVEGDSPLARACGFRATPQPHISVRSIEDLRAADLRIIWEKPFDTPLFEIPLDARVFARERWTKAPLLAGYRRGAGAVLWLATSPGPQGYERFPYLPQALLDLGLDPPFRSQSLWAFFDSAYRSRVDVDYFAARWREAGIGALHVAAWHTWERDPQADEYLRRLIEACHRNAIQVYAWMELPHVSENFWEQHPEWREKTAVLQDAQLDWRKLMNLSNPAAFAAVATGARDLLTRFDWDGVNLAELYFESLEGAANPARFTPMNEDIRAEFRQSTGFDPLDLFHGKANPAGLARFLDFRAQLAQRQQIAWLGVLETVRKDRPHLDITLTHIDDRFDTTMRDKLGADVSRVLPLLAQHDFIFLIEDPATIWNLGPQRYPQIAARYAPLTPSQDKLAIDINIVERYQDVYPTKQQTGVELFELIHTAANAFPRVALYFENSLSRQDLPLLGSAAAGVDRAERVNGKVVIDSRRGVGVPWHGPALVDGKPWPFASDSTVWLTKGTHVLEPAPQFPALRVLDFNGELKTAAVTSAGLEFAYSSSARAMAILDRAPAQMEIDGVVQLANLLGTTLLLPRGQHVVNLR